MRRNAFTLVEILVVLVIISVLAGMITTAVRAATETAKRSRTRGIISTVDEILISKYESYKNRPLPVVVPTFTPTSMNVTAELEPREAARVRLIMIRDLMRMEMPDRISDVRDPPMGIKAVVRPVQYQQNAAGDFRFSKGSPIERTVDWYTTTNPPAAYETIRQRLPSNPNNWTRENESAECLYLIIATTFNDGVPAISSIPDSNIGDTDGDQVPEILDGWGNPLGYIRWPVGYLSTGGTIAGIDAVDEFDPFRVDWAFVNGVTSDPPAHPAIAGSNPFAIKPLVVSAGPDDVFDLLFGFGDPNDYQTDIRYSRMTWPTSQMGADTYTRTDPYPYIDPYARQLTPPPAPQAGASRPAVGQYFDEAGDGDLQRADNITNYELEETT